VTWTLVDIIKDNFLTRQVTRFSKRTMLPGVRYTSNIIVVVISLETTCNTSDLHVCSKSPK
jgi:hypothetical protein